MATSSQLLIVAALSFFFFFSIFNPNITHRIAIGFSQDTNAVPADFIVFKVNASSGSSDISEYLYTGSALSPTITKLDNTLNNVSVFANETQTAMNFTRKLVTNVPGAWVSFYMTVV